MPDIKKDVVKDVVLVEHPVSLEEKAAFRREGLRVIDVRQKDNVNPETVVKTVMKEKDSDGDGLLDGDKELEAARDECEERGISFNGNSGIKKLKELIEIDKAK